MAGIRLGRGVSGTNQVRFAMLRSDVGRMKDHAFLPTKSLLRGIMYGKSRRVMWVCVAMGRVDVSDTERGKRA
jgi:hypothetical protein